MNKRNFLKLKELRLILKIMCAQKVSFLKKKKNSQVDVAISSNQLKFNVFSLLDFKIEYNRNQCYIS